MPQKYSDDQVRAMYGEYARGDSDQDIEQRHGIDRKTLALRWRKLGLKLLGYRNRPHKNKHQRTSIIPAGAPYGLYIRHLLRFDE